MKVTVLLRNDHETIKSHFAKYRKPNTRNENGKKELFEAVRREILLHSQMELEIFYPALQETASIRAGELVAEARADHQKIEKLLEAVDPQDRSFDAQMNELIEAVEGHLEMEEAEIFEEARKSLPEYRLEQLGLEVEERRRIAGNIAA